MKKYYRILFFLILPLYSNGHSLSVVPSSRTVTKIFNVGEGAQLTINNKYGKVNMQTWDKNQIQAVITITANGSNNDNAKSLANQVTIQSTQSGNNVTLTTQYDPNTFTSFWKRFFNGSGNQRNYIHIDYIVYLPRSLAGTHVTNNYGDVTGDNIPGDLFVDLNYGNFHVSKVSGEFEIDVNYGTGTLSNINQAVIHANYTDFNLGDINNLQIQSNYSDYKISNAGQVSYHGNYGNFSAGQVNTITCGSNYTDYKIGTLERQANMKVTYGDIRIGSLGNQFKGMNIQSVYGNVKAGIPADFPLRLDIDLTHGNLNTGKLPLRIEQKISDHGKSILKASVQGGAASSPVISINGTYSDVSISVK